MMDDLLLQKVDNELDDQPIEGDDANAITSVQVTNEWTNFRNQLSNDITMVEETKKKSSSNYLTWTDEMDKTLLDVLVDQHNRGDHAQNGWKPHVYNAAIKGIHDKCGLDLTKEKIWSRMKTFHKHYEVISKILSQSRFASYWVNNKLLIDSDDVWDKYVKANDKEACYKNKEVKNWEVICTIYSKDHATDEGAMTSAESEVPPIVPDVVAIEASPELPSKRMRTHDAILCMLGDMKGSVHQRTVILRLVMAQGSFAGNFIYRKPGLTGYPEPSPEPPAMGTSGYIRNFRPTPD
ncbi:hypothetical protein D1007_56068 [Hordeum vulgare]|nr:hypothetical protein D1007_56068 [Hordeum vulgare]